MKAREIREMDSENAKEKLAELRKELSKQKAVVASGTRPENPGQIRALKKDIARILTVLNQRKKEEEVKN